MFSILVIGCLDVQKNEQPDPFLGEQKMATIITDIVLLDGMKTSSFRSFSELNLKPDEYIYEKHDIDSTQLAKHMAYFADHPEEYLALLEIVRTNLEERTAQLDSLVKQRAINIDPDSIVKRESLDSISGVAPVSQLKVQSLDSLRKVRTKTLQESDTLN